ncbi:MAG: deoxyribose-phosphate aldolase [Propionibacteriaceae bacterium]|jgi:deoxyribose-phosphate aldolase|nr:deoxyribose-phosphate aldolase [Propionibacteriaceae bacterium]
MIMNRQELAQMIDHTILKPEATATDVEALVAQGVALGVYSVCISPSMLPIDVQGLKVATVCGFPSGAHHGSIKAAEATQSITDGADEIDMVINLGFAKTGQWDRVQAEIEAVRQATSSGVLKVIIESAVLTDEEIISACQAAKYAGADFVKTSTGMHPAGGASVHAVQLMKDSVGDSCEVKASGGIRTLAEAMAMIEAGATRLGVSASAAILAEMN